ncbi:MAG: hypothetical protein KGI19_10820 [Thaumarchaeota archaeon]|nr:hypothetical protein [Nitrososphaerota archaeon]
MVNEKFVSINPHALTVNAFLGGIAFTVLATLLQIQPKTFKLDILIPMTATSGILLLLATIGTMNATNSKDSTVHQSFYILIRSFTTIGVGILLMTIPFLFIDYDKMIFFFVFFIAIIGMGLLAIFNVINESKKRNISL